MKTYILSYFGKPVAVVQSPLASLLQKKIQTAIIEEVGADKDGQFGLLMPDLPDYGETIDLKVNYVSEGQLISDNEFTLTKTVCY